MIFPWFHRSNYATLSKLEKIVRKEVKRFNLEYRKNNDTFIISSDRADLGIISFNVYARSFDVQAVDIYGSNVIYPVSIVGEIWQEALESKIKFAIFKMANLLVRDGTRINLKWMNMVQNMDYEQESFKDIGDGQAMTTIHLAKALAAMSLEKAQ